VGYFTHVGLHGKVFHEPVDVHLWLQERIQIEPAISSCKKTCKNIKIGPREGERKNIIGVWYGIILFLYIYFMLFIFSLYLVEFIKSPMGGVLNFGILFLQHLN